MADNFNVYREWLGLESGATPNYYELLSLAPLETDLVQIAAAAERARTKVRSFRPGQHARLWSQLLDEIQAAKECLTDPSRKSEYDARLHLGGAARSTAAVEADKAISSAAAPPNSELYPPGMGRPANTPQLAETHDRPASLQPRPRSDLDPPLRGAPSPEPSHGVPIVTATLLDDAPSSAATETGWAAGPSPIYGTATGGHPAAPYGAMPAGSMASLPMAQLAVNHYPAAYPQGVPADLDPMAPVAVGDLLPPGAEQQAEMSQLANAMAIGVAPSAASVAVQRRRQARWTLMLASLASVGLIAAVLAIAVVVSRRVRPSDGVLAENPLHSVNTSQPQPPARSDARSAEEPQPLTAAASAPSRPADLPEIDSAVTPNLPVAPASSPPPNSPPSFAPVPAPMPEPPAVTRDEAQALIKALETAKAALAEQNFQMAERELAKAESLAKLPRHQEAVARLKEIGNYVKQFRQAVAAAVRGMQAAETFTVGNSTQVSFVEGSSDKVVLRIAGMNRTYPFSDMPPGLAVAIADLKLAANDPASRVMKGAYLLVHKRVDSVEREKALALWQEAQAMGANVSHLMPFASDNYADFLKDVATE